MTIKNISLMKILSMLLCAALILSMCGCKNMNLLSKPTFSIPTEDKTVAVPTEGNVTINPPINENTEGSVAATASPTNNTSDVIIFNDLNLENIVRNIIGKNIGSILRSDVEGITKLSARVRGISNIEALKYFTNLEELDLYGNRVSDISPLSGLALLKKLNLGKNYNVITSQGNTGNGGLDLSPLKSMSMLEELDLSDNMINDISGLSSLNKLKTLVLKNNRISDVSPLVGCSSMIYLDISDNYGLNPDNTERGISDLSPLYNINTLEVILCTGNLLSDLNGIEKMKSIRYVDFSRNYIQSLENLSQIQNLENLVVSQNFITLLEPLKDNKVIKQLDVSSNMITDFSVINTMSALKELVWENNNITDYSPIEEFENKNIEAGDIDE